MNKDILKAAQQRLPVALLGSLSMLPASESFEEKNYNEFKYEDGSFRIMAVSRPSPATSHQRKGMVSIWWNNRLIWIMQYAEEYFDEDRPLIRRILRMSHREVLRTGEFMGARGYPERVMQSRGLVYTNSVHEHSDFAEFSGHESLRFAGESIERGRCDYWGVSLI